MNPRVGEILGMIRRLEAELEVELARKRAELAFTLHGRTVQFEERILKRHRELKTGLLHYVLDSRPLLIITAPLIYAPIVAFALLDVMICIYQAACFPVYGIERVRRRDYFVFDRQHLAYLNAIERLNCLYCSYANGLIGYVREIASRTEQYWCPIKHSRRVIAAHERYARFADYGDAEHYQQELERLRKELREESGSSPG